MSSEVKGIKSPYDGDTLYWAKRMGKHPELKNSIAKLLKKRCDPAEVSSAKERAPRQQKGKCNWCELTFQDGDIIETDHITPKALGGKEKDNLQLLHKHCHDTKTKYDLKAIKKHKVNKEWNKTLKQFNNKNWIWIDDIPTMV